MDWVGVIRVCLSITEETPPGPADGEGGTKADDDDDDHNDNDNDNNDDDNDDDDDHIGVIGVCPSIRTETPPGRQMGKLPEGEKGENHPLTRG